MTRRQQAKEEHGTTGLYGCDVLQCSFGAAPSALSVLPANCVTTGTPAATIMDNKPFVNILPFGMCISPANPEVIAETAAALGVLTPAPCIPAIVTCPGW